MTWLTSAEATGGALKSAAALEAMRSVRVQQSGAWSCAARRRDRTRRFDEDILRLGRDHRVPAAHHAGESDGFLLVGDDEVVGIERALHSIQGAQLLAFTGAADD